MITTHNPALLDALGPEIVPFVVVAHRDSETGESKLTQLEDIPKESNMVVYCSIGYRSEKIGEKLLRLGYKNVYNLYGSIFEWANDKYPLVGSNGKTTNRVHCYNKSWGKWVTNDEIRTVW